MSRVQTDSSREGRKRQTGGIAIMTVLLLPILFGLGAFVIDLARMYVYRSELQTAMDGCALGASLALTGSADNTIFERARAYGLVSLDPSRNNVAGAARPAISVNRLHFQADALDTNQVAVEFSNTLGGANWVSGAGAGLDPQNAKFVRCRYTDADNPLFFLPLLAALAPVSSTTLSVGAFATASLSPSQSACAVPMGICKTPGTTKDTADGWGLTIGQRFTVAGKAADYTTPGFFGWLDFTPPGGGANELANMLTGTGSCAVKVGDTVGQPGAVTSVEVAWNSRFGLYGPGALTTTNAPPDFTGYGYSKPLANNYADYAARYAARAPFQSTTPNNWNVTSSANHGAFGQRRRVATAPIVDCAALGTGGLPVVEDFACVLLLAPVQFSGSACAAGGGKGKGGGGPSNCWGDGSSDTIDIEYLGRANRVDSPCVSSGLGGGSFGPMVPTLVQ